MFTRDQKSSNLAVNENSRIAANENIQTLPAKPQTWTIKGTEILCFPSVEVEQILCKQKHFVTGGTLKVLYFEQLDYFVLCLNDWKYPIIKTMPITCLRCGLSRATYVLPTNSGSYILKLKKIPNVAGLQNFEIILENTCKFSHCRQKREEFQLENAKIRSLTSMDKMRKAFKKVSNKLTTNGSQKRRNHVNFWQIRTFNELKNTSEGMIPSSFFTTHEVEKWINYNKHIASKFDFALDNNNSSQNAYSTGLSTSPNEKRQGNQSRSPDQALRKINFSEISPIKIIDHDRLTPCLPDLKENDLVEITPVNKKQIFFPDTNSGIRPSDFGIDETLHDIVSELKESKVNGPVGLENEVNFETPNKQSSRENSKERAFKSTDSASAKKAAAILLSEVQAKKLKEMRNEN